MIDRALNLSHHFVFYHNKHYWALPCVVHMKSDVMQCSGWSVDHPRHCQDKQSRRARWNPRPGPVPARPPSKSWLRCCAVVRHHLQELSGTGRVVFASSRLNCLSVPHWLLEKWGVLGVKWRVTDEATESNPCALGERALHPGAEVNVGKYSRSLFLCSPSDSSPTLCSRCQ